MPPKKKTGGSGGSKALGVGANSPSSKALPAMQVGGPSPNATYLRIVAEKIEVIKRHWKGIENEAPLQIGADKQRKDGGGGGGGGSAAVFDTAQCQDALATAGRYTAAGSLWWQDRHT